MLKFGVCDVEALKAGRVRSAFGRRKRASVLLLNELSDATDAQQLYELVMFGLVDDRGAFKRTTARRFERFDLQAVEMLSREFGDTTAELRVHDTGVSSGQTAVDFYEKLSAVFPHVDYRATDYDHELTVVRDGRLVLSLSSDGAPVEIQYRPFVFSAGRSENPIVYPGNFLVRRLFLARKVRRLSERFRRDEIPASEIEKIDLFCPAARSLAQRDGSFSLGRHDLLAPNARKHQFDCVRAMNVLNRNYFSDEQMHQVLGNIHESLTAGGILVAGSNQDADSPVEGGVFRHTPDGFEPAFIAAENTFLQNSIENFAAR